MRRSHPATRCLLKFVWAGDSLCNLTPGLALHTERKVRATHFSWAGCPFCFDSGSLSAGSLFPWAVAPHVKPQLLPEAGEWQLLPPDGMHLSGSGEETRVDVWILCLRIYFWGSSTVFQVLKNLNLLRSDPCPTGKSLLRSTIQNLGSTFGTWRDLSKSSCSKQFTPQGRRLREASSSNGHNHSLVNGGVSSEKWTYMNYNDYDVTRPSHLLNCHSCSLWLTKCRPVVLAVLASLYVFRVYKNAVLSNTFLSQIGKRSPGSCVLPRPGVPPLAIIMNKARIWQTT